MKRIALIILSTLIFLTSCNLTVTTTVPDGPGFFEGVQVDLDMDTNFPTPDTLPDGEGKQLKVVLLLGQSNASGCSASMDTGKSAVISP